MYSKMSADHQNPVIASEAFSDHLELKEDLCRTRKMEASLQFLWDLFSSLRDLPNTLASNDEFVKELRRTKLQKEVEFLTTLGIHVRREDLEDPQMLEMKVIPDVLDALHILMHEEITHAFHTAPEKRHTIMETVETFCTRVATKSETETEEYMYPLLDHARSKAASPEVQNLAKQRAVGGLMEDVFGE